MAEDIQETRVVFQSKISVQIYFTSMIDLMYCGTQYVHDIIINRNQLLLVNSSVSRFVYRLYVCITLPLKLRRYMYSL